MTNGSRMQSNESDRLILYPVNHRAIRVTEKELREVRGHIEDNKVPGLVEI